MAAVDAHIVAGALDYITRYGLRKDGTYGQPGEACCTIGHVAVAWLDEQIDDSDIDDRIGINDGADEVSDEVLEAWDHWMADKAPPRVPLDRGPDLLKWSDGPATDEDVISFFTWWLGELTPKAA